MDRRLRIGIMAVALVVIIFFVAGFSQQGGVPFSKMVNDIKGNEQVGFSHDFTAKSTELDTLTFQVDYDKPMTAEFNLDILQENGIICQADPVEVSFPDDKEAVFTFQKCSLEGDGSYEFFVWTEDLEIKASVYVLKYTKFFDDYMPEGSLKYEIEYK
tara:strand:- start:56 stop:529 length:474 start_codon:yes stop_codon:yes gene_type:complete